MCVPLHHNRRYGEDPDVEVDNKLTFKHHLEEPSKMAAKTFTALSKIMPNHGGPRQKRRILLASVVISILLYGAPIWAGAIRISAYYRRVAAVYRLSTVRVTCTFSTVSNVMPPLDSIAKERRRKVNGEINPQHDSMSHQTVDVLTASSPIFRYGWSEDTENWTTTSYNF